MRFYLGAHHTEWLATSPVPLFVSHRRLAGKKSLPIASQPWALDSGGFTEIAMYGAWTITAKEYAASVKRYADEIGKLDFASPQDWMCEPPMLQKTGLSIKEHQQRTLNNYLELREANDSLPFIPVLQGWQVDDYLRHLDAYEKAGIDLRAEPRVGVGSVCRRQHTGEIDALIGRLRSEGLRLHGFGVKSGGLEDYGALLASSDSMAWSDAARKDKPLAGHEERHAKCSNCLEYGLKWRTKALARLPKGHPRLGEKTVAPWEELMQYPPGDTRISGAPATAEARQRWETRLQRTEVTAQRRLTPAWLDARPATANVWSVFKGDRYIGEIAKTPEGFVPVLMRMNGNPTAGPYEDLHAAARSMGVVFEEFDLAGPPTLVATSELEAVEAVLTFVHFGGNKVRFGLYDTVNEVVSSATYSTSRDAERAWNSNPTAPFRPVINSGEKAERTATVYIDYADGFWLQTRGVDSCITGGRYAGDIEIDGDEPVPSFVEQARQLMQRSALELF